VRGTTHPAPLPQQRSAESLISREDAKARRQSQRAEREPAASLPHTRALPCPARLHARLNAPSKHPPPVARAFQPEHCAAPHSTGVFDCPNAVSPGRLAPSPPTPLPRFTGARGGLCVFCVPKNAIATLAPGRGEGTGVRGIARPAQFPQLRSAAAFSTQFSSREDAKPRRETQRAGRELAASMPHTRAVPCPARLNVRLNRLKTPSRSSGFPARALFGRMLQPRFQTFSSRSRRHRRENQPGTRRMGVAGTNSPGNVASV